MNYNKMRVGIIGDGFVGSAIRKSLLENEFKYNYNLFIYDKYKKEDYILLTINDILETDIIFLALPTLYNTETEMYDLSAIDETLEELNVKGYKGICLIKSTILPCTTKLYAEKYLNLKLIHNPEFLSAKTAAEDFRNQSQIVLGMTNNVTKEDIDYIELFYKKFYKNAKITILTSTESEIMKLSANSFYSIKIQFFTEIYLLSKKLNCSYDMIRDTIINNGWVNPMHTQVPGQDGNISYGGACFPKDTSAFDKYLDREGILHGVLNATVNERNQMRQ
jgi:UDPglucose 6-dehydrogenase